MAAEKTWKVSLLGSWLSWFLLVCAFWMLTLAYAFYQCFAVWSALADFVRAEMRGATGFFTGHADRWADGLRAVAASFMPYTAVMVVCAVLTVYAAAATSAAAPKCPFLRFSAAVCALLVPVVFAAAAVLRKIGVPMCLLFVLYMAAAGVFGAALLCRADARIRRYCSSYHLRAQPPAVIA